MQVVSHLSGHKMLQLLLPPPEAPVIGRLLWGRHDELCSPAYWAAQSWMWGIEEPDHFRLGQTLAEELLACMLGGYGIPAETGLAAYERLRAYAADRPSVLCDELFLREALARPLHVQGRSVKYRFAAQKARFVSAAFRRLDPSVASLPDRALRDKLVELPGVGPKTASWVVRNLRGSDQIAILDVHLLRAGRILGIFDSELTVERHYPSLEKVFLRFASAIGTRSSILDSVIWMTMRQLPLEMLRVMVRNPEGGKEALHCDDSAS